MKKKNSSLRTKFEKQETDREYLVKQLVLQKKENEKLKQEVANNKKTLKA